MYSAERGHHVPAEMTAAIINDYGGPEMLRIESVPRPVPRPGEALIEIAAIGVNPADLKWRSGRFREGRPVTFPHILGYDIAGVVRSTAGGQTALPEGAAVLAMLGALEQGAYAQWVCAPTDILATLPAGLDLPSAAALPTAGLTAIQLIEEHLAVRAGHRVLVTGATGAVGRIGVALAKAAGAHVTAAVRPCYVEDAAVIGADAVVALGDGPFVAAPFDRIADTIGGAAVAGVFDLLAPSGSACTISVDPIPLAAGRPTVSWFRVRPDADQLARLAQASVAGVVALPFMTFALAEVADAHRRMEAGNTGKAVLIP